MTSTITTTPRVYVASLSDYNAGRLHGAWIDADQSADEIAEAVAAMLAASSEPGAEEWAIHDHEGFGAWSPGEWASFETVAAVGAAIAETGEPEVLTAWLSNMGPEQYWPADLVEGFAEAYAGTWTSLEDYAVDLYEGIYSEADMGPLVHYIDWERVARDLELGGDVWTTDTSDGVAVFRNV